MNAPHGGYADILTRTTLQIDGSLSPPSIARVVQTLHRVPGVLRAEINAVSARAIVAHDSAVSTASLLAAAASAGVRATIVGDGRTGALRAATSPLFARVAIQRVMPLIAALVLLQVLFGAVSASFAKTHLWLPTVLTLVLALVFFSAFFKHRT